ERRNDIGRGEGILHDGILIQIIDLANTLETVPSKAEAPPILEVVGVESGFPNIDASLISLMILVRTNSVNQKHHDSERGNDPWSFVRHSSSPANCRPSVLRHKLVGRASERQPRAFAGCKRLLGCALLTNG